MVTIFRGRAIKIAWTIYKGVSAVRENFDRANVVCFLIDHRRNKIAVSCRQEDGTIYVDIPEESLRPGIYSIELLWAKNRDFTRPHNWEIAPWVLNHTFMDSRNIVRCLKEDLFAVSEFINEESSMIPDEGTVVIKAKSSAATYGYDGLDAYEMSVVFGYTTLSRDEWLEQLNDPQKWFMDYLSELIRLNNLVPPNAKSYKVSTQTDGNCQIECNESVLENQPLVVTILAEQYCHLSGVTVMLGDERIDIAQDERVEVDEDATDGETVIKFTVKSVVTNVSISATAEEVEYELHLPSDGADGWWENEEYRTVDTFLATPTGVYTFYFCLPTGMKLDEVTGTGCDVTRGETSGGKTKVTISQCTKDAVISVSTSSDENTIDISGVTGYKVWLKEGDGEFGEIAGQSADFTNGATIILKLEAKDDYSINMTNKPQANETEFTLEGQPAYYILTIENCTEDVNVVGVAYTKPIIYNSTEGVFTVQYKVDDEENYHTLGQQGWRVRYGAKVVVLITQASGSYIDESNAPRYTVGGGTAQPITMMGGTATITINSLTANLEIYGKAVVESRVVWGEYTQESFNTQDIVSDLRENAQTMFDDAVSAGRVVNSEVTTPNITTNSFFVCYPSGHRPTIVETQFNTPFEEGNIHPVVTVNNNPNYVIWAFENSSSYAVGGQIKITK